MVHVYETATGLLTGVTLAGSSAFIEANLPPGCNAITGVIDPLRQRVDVDTGELVAYEPPSPPLSALQATRVSVVDADLARIERRQQRPLGDILVAMTAGQAPAAPDVAALAQLRADAAAARTVRALMLASTTPEQLAAIVWPLEAP